MLLHLPVLEDVAPPFRTNGHVLVALHQEIPLVFVAHELRLHPALWGPKLEGNASI